jgi:hypothetical protein
MMVCSLSGNDGMKKVDDGQVITGAWMECLSISSATFGSI